MDVFKNNIQINSKKVYQVQALYNTSSTLEFIIQADKDFILASDVYLNFSIVLEVNYIPDNQVDKLFDSVEVIIGSEKVSSRSNSNEYFLSSFFRTKANHPSDHFNNMLRPSGWWSNVNFETAEILAEKSASNTSKSVIVDSRTSEVQKNNSNVVTGRVYHFSTQIHSPLFQQMKPLPSNVPIQINFKRARPEMAVIKCTDDSTKYYATHNIDIINPYLEVTAIRSDKWSKKLDFNTKGTISYDIEESVIRTQIMETGINHVNFSATSGGKLPTMMFAAITKPDAFNGDETKSATRYQRHGLSKFEIFVDNTPVPGSLVDATNTIDVYSKFYRQCKMMPNFYAGRIMSTSDFMDTNMILAYDLSEIGQETGWLSVKLDFKENLSANLLLIVCMIYDKTITFDKDRNVQMT